MATLPQAILDANQVGAQKDPRGSGYTESKKLYDHIRKHQSRISRWKKFLTGIRTEGNAALQMEAERKILISQRVINDCIMKLKQRNAEKNRIDAREIKKFLNRQNTGLNKQIRLEKGQLAEVVKPEVKEGPKYQGPNKLTIYRKTKQSTAKNPQYEETTMDKIKNDFFIKVNTPTPKKREKIVSEPFPYMKKKRMLARYNQNNP